MYIFTYNQTVSFDETNLVGNVYFAHYFHWQGKCREDFIRCFSPGILDEITSGLCLVTTDSTCKFHKELFAFDEVLIEMPLTLLRKRRCRMDNQVRICKLLLKCSMKLFEVLRFGAL